MQQYNYRYEAISSMNLPFYFFCLFLMFSLYNLGIQQVLFIAMKQFKARSDDEPI